MRLQINKSNNLTNFCALVRRYTHSVLIRLSAILVMFNLITPTFFIGEPGKASAQNLPKITVSAKLTPVISAPPKSFLVSSSTFEVSGLLPNKFAASIGTTFGSIPGLFSSDAENNSSLIPYFSALSQPAGSVQFDFDGDGKADLARWKSAASEWKIKNSSSGSLTTVTLGNSSSIIAPGDFDGDSKTDAAVFNAGTWTIKKSASGQNQTVSFGIAGDKPVVSDYDGDGLADCAVFRASTNTWWILKSSNGSYASTAFGAAGDITAQGNFDGDTKTDLAIFRPNTGDWHVLGSSAGYFTFHWGIASDIPVPADYDGDGKTDFAVYRGSSGTWYVSKSSTNNANYTTQVWGNYGDQPVPADTDGDNKADYAIWRPTTGVWHTIKSSNGQFDYQTLGQTGETAVTSAYLKQIGGAVAGYNLAKARLAPKNATGGTDLYSRNFSWGTGLVGLSGRAGLGAGFGISYNSLVWTKEPTSNAVYFNADNSNVSPGFRFGFPTIEPVYWDKTAERFNYLLVTPSGGRVEFRQIGVSDTYETADSSYTQIKTNGAGNPNDPVENISITLSGTDGSKMTYLWKAGAFRCSEIKDRNGNFITIVHDDQGLLRTVTDTLGRVITVNYDQQLDPVSITQMWKDDNGKGSDVQYTWATFTYSPTAINPNFASGINIVGPTNGTTLKVLQKITFPSGSATTFDYNAYGQVKQVSNYAADLHLLNYTRTNLETPAANQTDCPRFTETRNWVENFNQNTGGVAQETVMTNTLTENQTYNVGGISGTATKIEVSMANDPYNHVSKTFVGSSGWRESLPIATEDWANGTGGLERKRWTWTNWTQDDTNASSIQNPRTIESKVGDTTNIKRTTTEYLTYPATGIAKYGLTSAVNVYDADQTTVLKRAETDYNLSSVYTSRRIIGLPSETRLYGFENSALPLVSKVTYAYDGGNFSDTTLAQNLSTAIQHDNTNFGASFITGRGNTTSVTRYDVTGQTANVTSSIKYNTAGAAVAQIDPLGRTVKIGYADAFNDNLNRNSFAYPTTLTDPANNSSTVKYRYDTGANVRANSPAPAGNPTGKQTTRLYDSIGRLSKETLVNTGAYSRYEYPANQVQSKVFSTVIDINNNGADTADEVFAESWTDGAGRVRRSRTEHPNSTGGYAGSLVEYDILGQVTRSTVPTEINANYEPAGDDAVRGWLWTAQEYDWKGRPTRTVNTDGTDTLASYDGCGCAGGQITTIQGELVPRDDQPSVNARRTQKIYADILGRSYKTEVMNWSGSVYTTTVQTFNGRDQVTNTRQFDGDANSYVYRDVSMTYDGHGRMKTRHYPIENAGANTSWTYNADDSMQTVTDPRGVLTNFIYNSRGLLETVSYDPQNTGIADTPDVTFAYDALGNRTSLADGTGSTAYAYNSLSQLTAETKTITELANSYTINYTYTLGGGLKSVGDPLTANQQVNFSFDKTGRTLGAEETLNGAAVQAVSDTKFRAWGAIKELKYNNQPANNNPGHVNFTYDNALQISQYQAGDTYQAYETVSFDRFADGKLKSAYDDSTSWRYRAYSYDYTGRLTKGLSGAEANPSDTSVFETPYLTNMSYNSFGESTATGKNWGRNMTTIPYSIGATSGRLSTSGYDAAGNVTQDRIRQYVAPTRPQLDRTLTYDAANRMIQTFDPKLHSWENDNTVYNRYDGNGWRVKNQKVSVHTSGTDTDTYYEIRSTVLGGETVGRLRLYQNNPQKRFIVPVSGRKLVDDNLLGKALEWSAPEGIKDYNLENPAMLDPRGADVGFENPYNQQGGDGGANYPSFGDPTNAARCSWEGSMIPCGMADRFADTMTRAAEGAARKQQAAADAKHGGTTAHESMHDTTTARATGNTQKPTNTIETGSLVLESSVPNSDGESKPPTLKHSTKEEQKARKAAAMLNSPVGTEEGSGNNISKRAVQNVVENLQEIDSIRHPNPFINFNQQLILNSTRDDAYNRIVSIKSCKDFFLSLNSNALEILKTGLSDVKYAVGDKYLFGSGVPSNFAKDVPVVTTSNVSEGKRQASGFIYFNSSGYFFSGRLSSGKDITEIKGSSVSGLSLDLIRQQILLHEWVHVLDVKSKYDDFGSSNRALNEKINKECHLNK